MPQPAPNYKSIPECLKRNGRELFLRSRPRQTRLLEVVRQHKAAIEDLAMARRLPGSCSNRRMLILRRECSSLEAGFPETTGFWLSLCQSGIEAE